MHNKTKRQFLSQLFRAGFAHYYNHQIWYNMHCQSERKETTSSDDHDQGKLPPCDPISAEPIKCRRSHATNPRTWPRSHLQLRPPATWADRGL